jgi:hypothetical protein
VIAAPREANRESSVSKMRVVQCCPGFLRLPLQVALIADKSSAHAPDLTYLFELAIIVMNDYSIM